MMTRTDNNTSFDYILVGGGLQSGLIALALWHHRPDSRVLLIERDHRIGGNHTWSFHPGDVPESCRCWIEPLIKYRWPSYEVRLGAFRRHVRLPYASIPSDHFARVVSQRFDSVAKTREGQTFGEMVLREKMAVGQQANCESIGIIATLPVANESSWQLMTNADVINVKGDNVITRCGQMFRGRSVIDCRGPADPKPVFAGCGFQKFYGFEVELDEAWPFESPIIMDSDVDQGDGFRFVYSLPLTQRRVLVEDTRFSDTPNIDRQESCELVRSYLRRHGVDAFEIVREEFGVLPMPFSSELMPASSSPLSGGYAGGWFHAATGYSFPMAVAFAEAVASGSLGSARGRVNALAEKHRWRAHYSRFLNRLLFRLIAPRQRHRIFRRFYRVLSDASIERFYSHQFNLGDAIRIVVGVPPTIIGLRPFRFIRSFLRGDAR
jgi:lycopene beta-cyclase